MLPDNETITFEDQLYVNPEASLKEQNAFIDNLRGLQKQNNAEINTQTYNLGTAVPSNLGGLTGGEGYFTARYQTPQSTSLAANLRTAAQAQALNEVLSNELAMQKQRYNKAYKAARRRAGSYGSGGGSTTGGNNENTSGWDGEVEDIATDGKGLTAVSELSLDAKDMAQGGQYIVEPASGNIIRVINGRQYVYKKNPDGSYTAPPVAGGVTGIAGSL